MSMRIQCFGLPYLLFIVPCLLQQSGLPMTHTTPLKSPYSALSLRHIASQLGLSCACMSMSTQVRAKFGGKFNGKTFDNPGPWGSIPGRIADIDQIW